MLSIKTISKSYGPHVALNQLSLDIAPGQFCVLLGPNGAGKSTLFQVLTGLFAPDAGEVTLFGVSLAQQPQQVLARLGVVFQQQSLDLDLSVQRNLAFHAQLHGFHWRDVQARQLLNNWGPRRGSNRFGNCPGATGARLNWRGRCCTARH
jgi:ABC-2 type transport system ATP-binding protein